MRHAEAVMLTAARAECTLCNVYHSPQAQQPRPALLPSVPPSETALPCPNLCSTPLWSTHSISRPPSLVCRRDEYDRSLHCVGPAWPPALYAPRYMHYSTAAKDRPIQPQLQCQSISSQKRMLTDNAHSSFQPGQLHRTDHSAGCLGRCQNATGGATEPSCPRDRVRSRLVVHRRASATERRREARPVRLADCQCRTALPCTFSSIT